VSVLITNHLANTVTTGAEQIQYCWLDLTVSTHVTWSQTYTLPGVRFAHTL